MFDHRLTFIHITCLKKSGKIIFTTGIIVHLSNVLCRGRCGSRSTSLSTSHEK